MTLMSVAVWQAHAASLCLKNNTNIIITSAHAVRVISQPATHALIFEQGAVYILFPPPSPVFLLIKQNITPALQNGVIATFILLIADIPKIHW